MILKSKKFDYNIKKMLYLYEFSDLNPICFVLSNNMIYF